MRIIRIREVALGKVFESICPSAGLVNAPWSMQVEYFFLRVRVRGASQDWPRVGFNPAQPAGRSHGLRQITLLPVFGQESMPVVV